MSTGAHLDHLLLELLLLLGDSLVENTWSVGKHEPTHRMRIESGDVTLDFLKGTAADKLKRPTEENTDKQKRLLTHLHQKTKTMVTIIREATFWQWATWTEV